jgi:hypothetical protein
MPGSVVSRSGGTPAIESPPGNAEAWLRTRPSAALALAKPARDGIYLWYVELAATSPQSAEDIMRLILSADDRAQTAGLYFVTGLANLYCSGRAPDALGRLPGLRFRPVALLLRSARESRLDLDSERIHLSVSLSGDLSLLAFATLSSFQMLPPDFETGRLPAFRHALNTITWDGPCA